MIGELQSSKVTLTYRHRARPLLTDNILNDLDEAFRNNQTVQEIQLWEHQWDWLVRTTVPAEADRYLQSDSDSSLRQLFGIPVTFLSNGNRIVVDKS